MDLRSQLGRGRNHKHLFLFFSIKVVSENPVQPQRRANVKKNYIYKMSHADKLKVLLESKELQCHNTIRKLKKKRKIIKIISVSLSLSTITILSIMASSLILSPLAISILSIISATLVGIDCKFKFQNKSTEIYQHIEKLNRIKLKLEYIKSCNGNLTDRDYEDLFRDCNAF